VDEFPHAQAEYDDDRQYRQDAYYLRPRVYDYVWYYDDGVVHLDGHVAQKYFQALLMDLPVNTTNAFMKWPWGHSLKFDFMGVR